MRKSTKLAALVAGLVAICAITAVAAGWVNEGGAWYYTDKNGDYVTSTWKADGSNYYYLGEDGEMLTNQIVEDGENVFYVGADGARVHDTWVAVEADDSDAELDVTHRWYYFQSNGKAYKSKKNVTINGKKYTFDEYGKMVFGFVDQYCEIINDHDDAPLYATYYYGDNDDGALYTGWLQWTEGFTVNDYDDYGEIWFWFNTSKASSAIGKKFDTPNKEQKINGVKYTFDANGVMQSGWNATPATATASKWFSDETSGALVKNSWIYAVPSTIIDGGDNDDETSRWFWTDKNGNITAAKTKKINGKYYTFDKVGRMKAGLALMDVVDATASTSSPTNYVWKAGLGSKTAADIIALGEVNVFYFSGDEKADGSMKTGTYKIDLDDDTYSFTFDKHGCGLNGVNNQKVYINGMLLSAGDDRYAVVTDGKGVDYLVGSTGTIVKAGKYVKDANDDYYAVYSDGTTETCVKITDSDEASKQAKAFASKGTAAGVVVYTKAATK